MSQDKRVDLVLSVTGRYYAAKCNHCGWVGSSEFCIENRLADDFEVLCPVCHRHISDDDPVAEDISKFLNKESVKIVQRKNAIIAQMREALRLADDLIDEYAADYEHRDNVDEIRDEIKAALAAERGDDEI